jgi:hypothetical protein
METTRTIERNGLSNLALVSVQLTDLNPIIAMVETLLRQFINGSEQPTAWYTALLTSSVSRLRSLGLCFTNPSSARICWSFSLRGYRCPPTIRHTCQRPLMLAPEAAKNFQFYVGDNHLFDLRTTVDIAPATKSSQAVRCKKRVLLRIFENLAKQHATDNLPFNEPVCPDLDCSEASST